MSRTRWIRNKLLGVLVLALGLVLALTSCSLFAPPQEATGAGPTSSPTASAAPKPDDVEVSFLGRDDLEVTVEPVEMSPVMTEALPAESAVHDLVDITLPDDPFPDTGATVTFDIDEPLPEDAAPAVVHWNEELERWEPLPSELSADGNSLSADVEHFSKYGWAEGTYRWLNQFMGNYGEPPSCPGKEPEWSDAHFFDDSLGPLLWCVGTDQKNSDILEVRVVGNRSSAMLISTAITPEWAWSDVLGNTSPGTWASTALGGSFAAPGMTNGYLLTPKGEYRFGFAKDKLFEFWRSGQTRPVLIQADTSTASLAAGVMYDAIAEEAGGMVAAVTTIVSLTQCVSGGADAASNPSVSTALGALTSCLDGRRGDIERYIKNRARDTAEDSWAQADKRSAKSIKAIRYAAAYYALVKGHLVVGAVIGDSTLDPVAFQLYFTPSTAMIQERLGRSGAQTYTGEAADATFSFEHPAGWEVQDSSTGMSGSVTVTGPNGAPLSTLEVLLVWGATCGGGICEMRPVAYTEDVPGKQPLSHSGDFIVRTVVIDLSDDPETRDVLGWEDNVRVMTSLTDAEAPVPTTLAAALMYGLGQVETGVAGGGGNTDRSVLFGHHAEFPTVEQAQEYIDSPEHQDVQEMIASFRG